MNYYHFTQNYCYIIIGKIFMLKLTHYCYNIFGRIYTRRDWPILWTVLMYDPYWMAHPRDMAPLEELLLCAVLLCLPRRHLENGYCKCWENRRSWWILHRFSHQKCCDEHSLAFFIGKNWFEIWSFAVAMRYGDHEDGCATSGDGSSILDHFQGFC